MKTKKIILVSTLLFLLFVDKPCLSQTEECINEDDTQPCCNEYISTDPRSDSNNQPYATNQGRPEMLNHFNWMSPIFNLYHPTGGYIFNNGPIEYPNPFYTEYEYLSHINYYHWAYPDRTPDRLDFWPEDGWELIHKNNGFQLNETDYLSSTDNRLGPYFILYNKYTGVLRFFAGLQENFIGIDNVLTQIEFIIPPPNNNPQQLKPSALLSNQTNISQSLDQYTEVTQIASSSKAPIGGLFWTSDFYMAYDPCLCHNRSELEFSFKTISEADLQLSGRLIGTSVPLDGSGNAPLQNGRDFLTSVFRNGFDANAGILTYKNIDVLAEKYKTPNLSFLERIGIDVFKAIIKGGGIAADGLLNSALGGPYNSLIQNSLGIKDKQKLGLSIFAGFSDQLNISLDPKKSIPNIGIIEAEMALAGNYKDESLINGADFTLYVPGSKDSEDENFIPWQKYPAYNEALGLFALLYTPTLLKETSSTYEFPFETNIVNYRLDINSLKYTFNPAAGIDMEKTKISASILIPDYDYNKIVPTELFNLTPGEFLSNDQTKQYYVTPIYPLGCLTKLLLGFYQIVSPGITEQELYNLNNNPEVLIKFTIDFVFKKNKYGVIKRTLKQYTYKLNIVNSDIGSGYFLNGFDICPFDLTMNQTHFVNSETINAWHNIEITGDLSADEGVDVNIIAADNIIVDPGVVISPNIVLKIDFPNVCEQIPPVSNAYIRGFCTGEDYKANQINPEILKRLDSIQKLTDITQNEISFNSLIVYPNPSTNKINITYSLHATSNPAIFISNSFGMKISDLLTRQKVSAGRNDMDFDVSNLPNGLYFITLISQDYSETKKFVVLH